MIIAVLTVRLYAPWVHSLKEKRMVVKSLLQKVQNHFNVSASEIEEQDVHQTIVLGFASIAANTSMGDRLIDHIVNFIEEECEAEMVSVDREFR